MSSPTCQGFFDCSDARKHLSLEQVMKMMIIEDENGCPVFKVSGNSPSVTNANTSEHLIEEDDNTTLLATLNAWKSSNPTFKVIEKVQVNSINKQAILITYTS